MGLPTVPRVDSILLPAVLPYGARRTPECLGGRNVSFWERRGLAVFSCICFLLSVLSFGF